MSEKDRRRYQIAKTRYKFITIRIPFETHEELLRARGNDTTNRFIVSAIEWAIENTTRSSQPSKTLHSTPLRR